MQSSASASEPFLGQLGGEWLTKSYLRGALSREPERSHKGPDDGFVQAAAVAICHPCIASALKVRRVLTGGKVRATLYALAFSVPST